ncbi:MAG: TRAP transporter small permease [Pseudodesulfovibrio sp.]
MEDVKRSLLDRVEGAMRKIAAACLMGMALLTGTDVLMRGVFNKPIFGSEEIVTILGIVVIGFALPYAHYQKSHIGVEILVRRFSRRVRRMLGLLTNAATLFLVGIITWRMFLYGTTLAESGEVSMNLELPEYMVVYVLGIGFLAYTACLIADIVKFFKGSEA